jgi:DnaK suppressor protein
VTSASTPPDPAARLPLLRTAALERIAAAQAELSDVLDSASSTTGDDEHDPEGATIGFERAQSAGSLRAAQASLAEIDAALARVDAGTYGACVRCGRPIGDARLDARPATAFCITDA